MGRKSGIIAALAAVGSAVASALYVKKKKNRDTVNVRDVDAKAISVTKKRSRRGRPKKVVSRPEVYELERIYWVGPAVCKQLVAAGITTLSEVKRYKKASSLAHKAGIGELTAQRIIDGVKKL